MPVSPTALALDRFGLGARPGERARVAADPRGWLVAQLAPDLPVPARLADRPSHPALMAELRQRRGGADPKAARQWAREVFRAEREVRFVVAATTAHPFRERWVRFFGNHLCVSAEKRSIVGIVGAHEREAIRPHVVGTFAELLAASTRHPAMLGYLDNQVSVGPDSPLGRSTDRGLNENLARELLELHTLGVGGGYDQADVVALAEILTGWTARVGPEGARAETAFVFARRRHQPGSKVLLGERHPESGLAEGDAALARLARHPATATHLATKLVRHFVADQPPAPVVERVSRCIRDTEGDLHAVGCFLATDDTVWRAAAAHRKLRTPDELAVAMARAGGWTDDGGEVPASLVRLEQAVKWMGQAPLSPPSPDGWPDQAQDWAGPEQVLRRVEVAERFGGPLSQGVDDPVAFADAVLGERLHPDTRVAVQRAPDRSTAVALVLAAPEFQWR